MIGPDRSPPTWLELAGLAVATAGTAVLVLGLALARLGRHDGWVALLGGVGVTVVAGFVVARRAAWRPAPWDWRAALVLGAVLVVAALQFFPGFPYAAKNRDPGVYVNHAVAIARQGGDTLEDPVVATGAEVVVVDGDVRLVTDEGDLGWRKRPWRAFPTDADDPAHVVPDFFHLWATGLATAHDVAGTTGLFNLTPLFALGAVGLVFLATRRAFGLLAAGVGAGLLAVNALQVWQAKFPTAESMSQFLYFGALLGVVLALTTRWRVAAALGGALVGVGFVARPEGVFVVGLAAVVLAALWAWDRIDGRAVAFTVGLGPPTLWATWLAYGSGARYAKLQQGLPSFREALAGAVALALVAGVVRLVRHRRPEWGRRLATVDWRRVVLVAGLALVGLFTLFLLVAWFREDLLGPNYRINKARVRARGYDELNLKRLALFVTPVALIAAVGALVVGVRRRWSAACWALVLPGLIVAPVLIWEPRIAPDLMWWGRRYVPMVVPTLLILVGVAAALVWYRRGPGERLLRVGTAVLVLAMGLFMLRQSADLWGHEEFGGSLGVVEALGGLPDADDAVFVWEGGSEQAANFAITPFTWWDRPALSGPPDPSADVLLALQEVLGDRPLYLVTDTDGPPPRAADALVEVERIRTELSEFEHGIAQRPRRARPLPVDLTVWQLDPEAAAADR